MPQSALQRRLQRLAHAINTKAERLQAYGRISSIDLAVIARDHPRCAYCGVGLDPNQGTFDHVIPFHRGGRNAPDNLVRCCYTCNRQKFTKTPDEYTDYLATTVTCPIDGIEFRPRWSQLTTGNGRYCSRRCAAKSRWLAHE